MLEPYVGNDDTKQGQYPEAADDYCPKSDNGLHLPDLKTAAVALVGGVHIYLDVNCALCGRSGCAGKFDADSDVQW